MKIKESLSSRKAKIILSSVGGLCVAFILFLIFKPCKHQWIGATCESPKRCELCDEVEGETLEHKYSKATCTEPKTCDLCCKTVGKALGHQWMKATCSAPKTCSVCGITEGNKIGHKWKKATCTEPKTCSVCEKTKGEAIGHSWIEATYSSPKTCSSCRKTSGSPLTKHNQSRYDGADPNPQKTYEENVKKREARVKEYLKKHNIDPKTAGETGETCPNCGKKLWDNDKYGIGNPGFPPDYESKNSQHCDGTCAITFG